LLEHELNNPGLREYTQVIIKEADRLQDLMKRLLSPHRPMQPGPVNIHEILERVRSLLTAEFPTIARWCVVITIPVCRNWSVTANN
jgi:two-component system nitrogen regulation sensor histidine kinase GlnL